MSGGFPTQFLSPFFEVGKIHIGGEVEAAGGLVDLVAGESLVVGIATQGAGGAAVVEGGHRIAVVDREHCAGGPLARPTAKPVPVAFVDFHALAGTKIPAECGGLGQGDWKKNFSNPIRTESQVKFQPAIRREFKDPARKGVGEFIGKNPGSSIGGAQGGGEVGMAMDAKSSEALVLGGAERAIDINEVVAHRAAAPPAEFSEDLGGELAVARSNFDDIAGFVFNDPSGEELGEGISQRGESGEVTPGSDIADSGGVVAEFRVIEGLAHEALEGEGAARFLLQREKVCCGAAQGVASFSSSATRSCHFVLKSGS